MQPSYPAHRITSHRIPSLFEPGAAQTPLFHPKESR